MDPPFLRRPLLLLLLLSCLLVSAVGTSGIPVLDTDGKPLLRGVPYYVRAPQVINLGNLGLESSGGCPLNVFLKPFPYGPAAIFFPERTGGNSSVLVDEVLSILFATPTKCSESTLWNFNRRTEIVTTGGALLPPTEVSDSLFRIARYDFPNRNFYQLLWCPARNLMCSTLGVTTEQLLRLTSQVLVVSFMKVPEGSAAGLVAGAVLI